MHPDQEYVLRTIKSRDVHFVRFWFTDMLGNLKSFAVNPSEIEHAFEEGMGFDASCINGFSCGYEADMLAFPDASTFQILPWRPGTSVARMFCSIRTPEGEEFEGDSRRLLARTVARLTDMGYEANLGPEVEYYYFKDSKHAELLDRGGYFDLTSLDSGSDLRRDTVLSLENMGIPVEYSHHEVGPSQHEVDLRSADAFSMADAVMTYRVVVKEIAAAHGVYASFMPKPREDTPGSGMHIHQSLFDADDNNVFFDSNDPLGLGLSSIAKKYLAGLVTYAPEFCLITNQYVNSYKRLARGGDAPAFLCWSHTNRHSMVRVPGYRPGNESACRLELRLADPACNPYLAFAAMLEAGMRGIREQLEIPKSLEEFGLGTATPDALERASIARLPESLGEAIALFEQSSFMKELLGKRNHTYLVEAKQREWYEYLRHVTSWERDRWMEVL